MSDDRLAYEVRRLAHKPGAFQEERIAGLRSLGRTVKVSSRWRAWPPVGTLAVDYAHRVFKNTDPFYTMMRPSWQRTLALSRRGYRERRNVPPGRSYPEARSPVAHVTHALKGVRMGVSPIHRRLQDGRVESRLLFSMSGLPPVLEEQAALLSLSFGLAAGRVGICQRLQLAAGCEPVFLAGAKHPWLSVCRACRRTRGRPRRAWLPDSLRPEFDRLRDFLDHRVSRKQLGRTKRKRLIARVQADARQVTDGLLPEAACIEKWQRLRREASTGRL